MRHGDPVLVGYVKAVVVLVDSGDVAAENDDFVVVGTMLWKARPSGNASSVLAELSCMGSLVREL